MSLYYVILTHLFNKEKHFFSSLISHGIKAMIGSRVSPLLKWPFFVRSSPSNLLRQIFSVGPSPMDLLGRIFSVGSSPRDLLQWIFSGISFSAFSVGSFSTTLLFSSSTQSNHINSIVEHLRCRIVIGIG